MQIHFCETGFDEVRNVVLRHAFLEGSEGGTENVEGSFASEAHELELVHGFVSPAGDGDGISGGIFEAGRGVAQMIEKCEAGGLFDADAAGANVLVGQRGGGDFRGALIFLPDADFEREMELFAEAAFFEGGDHKDGVADAREDEAYEAFAEAPTDSREVVERSAGGEEERVVFSSLQWRAAGSGRRIRHEHLHVCDALMKFVGSNGVNAVAEWLKGRQSRWQNNLI